ncbi:MAG: hypothetical protein ACRC9L_02040 [Brevinema sp.]
MTNFEQMPAVLHRLAEDYPLNRRYAFGIFPAYEALIAKDSYKAAKFGGESLNPEDFLRENGKEAKRYSEIPHQTVEVPVHRYSIESSVDWSEHGHQEQEMKNQLLLLESRTKFAMEKLFNSIEARQIDLACDASLYPSDHVIKPSKPWDDEDSDPIAQIEEAKNLIMSKIGIKPNRLTISDKVWQKLRVRRNLLSTLPDTMLRAGLTPEAFAEICGVQHVVIADTMWKKDGIMSSPWANNALLCYNPSTPSDPQNEPMFGVTIIRPLGYNDLRFYTDDARSSEVFAADRYLGWGIINPEAGVLFKDLI